MEVFVGEGDSAGILRAIFDSHSDAVIVIGGDDRIAYCNKTAQDLCGRYFRSFSPGDLRLDIFLYDDNPEFTTAYNFLREYGKSSGPIVSIMKSSEQEEQWFESRFSLLPDGSPFVLLTISDITQQKQTLDRMAESERRFKSLVQNSSGIIVVTDPAGKISYISDSVKRYLGYSSSDCRGRDFALFVHGRDIPSFRMLLANLCEKESLTVTAEIQLLAKGGHSLYFEVAGSNHLLNPSVGGFIFNIHDVTGRKHVDQVMQRISRQNELILDTASEGIFGITTRGLISFINPYAAAIIGRQMEDLLGVRYQDVFT
ncbi:MAG: PAS domain S-box protein, partial [Spirochaetota bacterium]